MIAGILIEGLIYGIMVLGVFISFRVLNFPDMTVDGSFPLGAVIMAVALINGLPAPAALSMAFAGGAAAGLITSLIHTRLRIPDLLSGILTMTMLYSVNLRIMSNRANISLLRVSTFFSRFLGWWEARLSSRLDPASPFPWVKALKNPDWALVIFCVLAVLLIKILLDLFFRTDYGLSLGALGSNPQLIISQGMNPDMIKMSGICLANGLTAVSGAFTSLYQGFADVGLGSGIVVSGLASLMMGEFLLRSNRISILTLRVILGSVLYRALMYFARNYGYYIHMTPNDLKLITGLLIILCIVISKTGFRSGPAASRSGRAKRGRGNGAAPQGGGHD
jgi:putative ABC transport system permease protein